jgi:cell wall-associated NlpC family hydrolase
MSVEAFLRAAGAAMGFARESFGTGGAPGSGSWSGVGAVSPAGSGAAGSGAAAEGFSAESDQIDGHVVALGDHDAAGGAQAQGALAAAGVGRDRMEAVIDAAVADVTAMGMSTGTPQGKRALVAAIRRRLEETKSTVDAADGDAQTRAAGANVTAAGYDGVGRALSPVGVPMSAGMPMAGGGMPAMSGMPMMGAGMPMMGSVLGAALGALGAGGANPMSAMAGLGSRASSGRGHHTEDSELGDRTGEFASTGLGGDAAGRTAVMAALSKQGSPYEWGAKGPYRFDCSGLVQWAWGRAGVALGPDTYTQFRQGIRIPPGQVCAGDLIFPARAFGEGGRPGPGHVQLALGPNSVIHAPQTGDVVRIAPMPSKYIAVRPIPRAM